MIRETKIPPSNAASAIPSHNGGSGIGKGLSCWSCWSCIVLVGWLVGFVNCWFDDLHQVIHQEVDSEFVAFAFGVSKFVQHDFIAILNDDLPLAFATHDHTWI